MNRKTLEEFLCEIPPMSKIKEGYSTFVSNSFDDQEGLVQFSVEWMQRKGVPVELHGSIIKSTLNQSFKEWLQGAHTYPLSGLPVHSGDSIYAGQIMDLHGGIREGEFELRDILFSPKEVDLLEEGFVFFYNDLLRGIPVFVPIKKQEREVHQSRMIEALNIIFDPITEAISKKREETSSMTIPYEHSLN